MTRDLLDGSFDKAVDKANNQIMWGIGIFLWLIALGLLFFAFSAHAEAAFTPTFIPDPSYPSGTSITNSDTSKYYVSYDSDTGVNDQGRINTGETGHPWLYWFNLSTTGKHIIVQMSDAGASSGTDCGYGSAMILSDCRSAPNYVAEFEVCLTDDTECTGGGGGGGGDATTTATTTIYYINNPNQDLFNGYIMLMITMFGVIWFFRKKN